MAEWLGKHPAITWVKYPGLKSSPYYALSQKYLPKGQGSIVTFGIKGGLEAGEKLIDNVKIFSHLANLGDAKSLIIHPASTTHQQLSDEQQLDAGVTKDLVRISVGIEDVEDLIWDLEQAIASVAGQRRFGVKSDNEPRPEVTTGAAARSPSHSVLLPDYQDVEAVREYRRAALLAFLGFRRGPVFGGQQVDAMQLFDPPSWCGRRVGGHVVHGFVLAVHQLHDAQRAVAAVGAERQAGAGIEAGAIGARPDGRSRDHFQRRNIDHGHHLVAADREELLVLHVDGQPGRAFARRQLGAARHGGFGGIDLHDLARGLPG